MANPLFSRAARAFLAGTLALSPGLSPAFAHMAGGHAGSVGMGRGHFSPLTQRGFSRYGRNHFVWSGQHGYGWNGRYAWKGYRWNDRGGSAWNSWRGYRWNGQGGYGWSGPSWAWGGDSLGVWGGTPEPAPAIVLGGGGPPVAINVSAGPAAGPSESQGGCVIHELQYDDAGKYIGERQSSNC